MKKTILTLLALSVLAISACKKTTNNDTGNVTGSGTATVSANNYGFDGGNSGKFSSTKAGIIQTSVGGITSFSISAIKDGSNESITIIVLKKITGTGRISFSPSDNNGGITISKDYTKPGDPALNYSTDQGTGSKSGGGEINITSLNGNQVEGTFYATAYNANGSVAFAEQGSFKGTIKQ